MVYDYTGHAYYWWSCILIIALIIFIATGNKKKPKTNKEVQEVQEASKQEAVATASQTVTPTPVVPTNNQVVTPQSPVVTPEPVVPATPVNSMAEKSVKEGVEPAVFTATIPRGHSPLTSSSTKCTSS